MSADDLVVGLDVGTQGARALVLNANGRVLGSGSSEFTIASTPDGWHVQDPERWLESVSSVLGKALSVLSTSQKSRVRAIGVTSTSGTLLLTDVDGRPVRPAIMWNDTRAQAEAEELADELKSFTSRTGLRLRGSFPLPKLLWLARNDATALADAGHVMHAADFLLWHLGLHRAVTDPTNALKTGYDPTTDQWDPFLDRLGVTDKLPQVVDSGTALGGIDSALADELGVQHDVVLAGTMTDANTSMLAAGVYLPGEWMTTLGTGLSIKGVLRTQLLDPTGSVYCHRDPRRFWLASGTSHCGAAAVARRFGRELDDLTAQAEHEQPGQLIIYPLTGRGEYFPFWNPEATGFTVGTGSPAAEFRSTLEGIAVVEHLAYRRLTQLGAQVGDEIVAAGGASRSRLWNKIRATVQGRTLRAVALPETAVGAAIAAFAALGISIEESIKRMVTYSEVVYPDEGQIETYQVVTEHYEDALRKKGLTL